jgi:AAA domain
MRVGSRLVGEDAGWRGSFRKGVSNPPNNSRSDHFWPSSCKAVFVDTDAVPASDSRVGDLVQNTIEASLVHQATETLLSSGVRQDQIGIISLYRQQIKVLSHLLQDRKEVEILTADRSQGRDKDCVIISMVRSNDAGQVNIHFSFPRKEKNSLIRICRSETSSKTGVE